MELVLDPDVKQALEHLQDTVPTDRLVAVATGVAALAPLLWGGYEPAAPRAPLKLAAEPISACDQQIRSVAIG